MENFTIKNKVKNTIGLFFKDACDYKDFKNFISDENHKILIDLGFDVKTKAWIVEVHVKTLEDIYGEAMGGNNKSGWYSGLTCDFESVIVS